MGKKGRRDRQKNKPPKNAQGIQIMATFEEGADFGYLYSYNSSPGRPEFIAFNVPRSKVNDVHSAMMFLESRSLNQGETVGSHGLYLQLRLLEGEEHEEILKTRMYYVDGAPQVFELIPRFEHKGPEDWGSRPKAPGGKENLVESILDVWADQGHFICFKDGNTLNCSMANLKRIDLTYALRHADTLKVDWWMNLSPEQTQYVIDNARFFRKLTRILFRPKEACNVCGATDNLRKCTGCKAYWYCGPEHQKEDWGDHKKVCKDYQDMKNTD